MGQDATAARTNPSTRAKPGPHKSEAKSRESFRDSVEAIVVALIVAAVVRGFEAQAFVIPTGSMAPTLMGRHKEIACPQCGFVYSVNASEEADHIGDAENNLGNHRVESGICVNCRYQARLKDEPIFKGDRIFVMLFPYDLTFLPGAKPPERWDVVVFHYPEDPESSYIKRLVGLPGETIRIHHGDLYVRQSGQEAFDIARKPYKHLRSMMIPVHDDRYQPKALASSPEWKRWGSTAGKTWTTDSSAPSRYRFEANGTDNTTWSELRYRHLVADPEQWDAVLNSRPLPRVPRPTLITDFYSYNTNMTSAGNNLIGDYPGFNDAWLQPHYMADLSLAANLTIESDTGTLRCELIKGGVPFRCQVDLSTGTATFFRGDKKIGEGTTPIRGKGSHAIDFSNVDNRLILAINGTPVSVDGEEGVSYRYEEGTVPVPTAADLSPAAFAVQAGTVSVSDLVLKRDIYYTQRPASDDYSDVWNDSRPRSPVELFDFLADPSRFPRFARIRSQEFGLGEDRFMMLGDNSPRSKDSRGWDSADTAWTSLPREYWEVPRNMLMGKAFYVYWPHGVPVGPVLFRPYFERMKWIR